MKADIENQKEEVSIGLWIGIAIFILYVTLALTLLVKGPSVELTGSRLIIVELSLLSVALVLLLFTKFIEAAMYWIASLKAIRWFSRYDASKRAQSKNPSSDLEIEELQERRESLRDALRERYGLLWRYRARWVLVSGEQSLVEGVAPGLSVTGWHLLTEALLINGSQKDGQPDIDWLNGLHKLRRRRPVDAIVALMSAQDSHKPFDADAIGQRLTRHARALGWAAPAYLLCVKESAGVLSKHDETIGCVWSNARASKTHIDTSLARLAGELSDLGVERLSVDHQDRVAAQLAQQIQQLGTACSDLVERLGNSRIWRAAVHGLLFAVIPHAREAGNGENDNDRSASLDVSEILCAEAG